MTADLQSLEQRSRSDEGQVMEIYL